MSIKTDFEDRTALLRALIEQCLTILNPEETFTQDQISAYIAKTIDNTGEHPLSPLFTRAYRTLEQKLEQSIAEKGPINGLDGRYQRYRGEPIAYGGNTQGLLKQHGLVSQYDLFAKLKEENFGTQPNHEAAAIQEQLFDLVDRAELLELDVHHVQYQESALTTVQKSTPQTSL